MSQKLKVFRCSAPFCLCFNSCLSLVEKKIRFETKWQSWKKNSLFSIFSKMPEKWCMIGPLGVKKCFLWINSCKRLRSKVRTRLPESMKRKWETHLSRGGIGKSIRGSYPSCVRLRQLWLYDWASIMATGKPLKLSLVWYIAGFSSLIRLEVMIKWIQVDFS